MENRINLLKKEVKTNYWFNFLMVFILYFTLCDTIIENKERLNEHKRLLIAQQEQINKLILNAEYNKIRYEQKQNR